MGGVPFPFFICRREEFVHRMRVCIVCIMIVLAAGMAACSRSATPRTVEKVVTVQVTAAPGANQGAPAAVAIQTVVVTATPAPTPSYVSKIDAAPGTLTYPLPADPQTLDPQAADDEASLLVVQQIYEGLFNLGDDGSLVPAAATGYQASGDGKTYTVTLRSGMKWSDGQPVTAQQFADGICRALDPALGSRRGYVLAGVAHVTGAAAYAGGSTADCSQVGVAAPDELHLRISLDRPVGFLPQLLAYPPLMPVRPESLQAGADPAGRWPEALPANGAYQLSVWTPGKQIVLIRNPQYWNAAATRIERIEFVVTDQASQFALYEQGSLHVASVYPKATAESADLTLARVLAEPALQKEWHPLPRPGISFLGLNTQVPPTNDANVRRAIASAIDRQALLDKVMHEPWHRSARALVPPGVPASPGDDAAFGYPYDLQAARAFLAQAGYSADNPPPPVEIWTNREGNNLALMQAIAGMLEEAGIPTRLVTSNWSVYTAALAACRAGDIGQCGYNLYLMGWIMDYADPASLLAQVGTQGSALGYTAWTSTEYQDLLAQAGAEPDQDRRASVYGAAEKMLLTDAAIAVPLFYYDDPLLIKAGITYDYASFGAPNLQYWSLASNP